MNVIESRGLGRRYRGNGRWDQRRAEDRRELETGTFRFAWTQGAGRTRWVISTLVLPGALVTAATGAFTAIFYWYFRPFLADGQVSEMLPLAFALLGVAFAAWTLLAFALAAFTGAVFRRTLTGLYCPGPCSLPYTHRGYPGKGDVMITSRYLRITR